MTVDALAAYGLEPMEEDEIRDFLTSQGFGVLSLPTGDAPYTIPLSFGYDGDSRLYFSFFVGGQSRKAELSREADAASFLVFSPDSVFFWESVLLTGNVGPLPDDEVDEHTDAMDNAWHLELFADADTAGRLELYQFEIEEQIGFKSMGLPPGMEEKQEE
jgi:nitroimidazol reductase NimA-like FMN-containing flavoprotein (pyridoxamine 5'-phosphate oxidase superfamily)